MAGTQNSVYMPITLLVDAPPRSKRQYVYAKQLDSGSRFLIVTLTSRDGQLTYSGSVILNAMNPNGVYHHTVGTINPDRTITFELTPQILSMPGRTRCDVTIVDEEDEEQVRLSSQTFYIFVDKTYHRARKPAP